MIDERQLSSSVTIEMGYASHSWMGIPEDYETVWEWVFYNINKYFLGKEGEPEKKPSKHDKMYIDIVTEKTIERVEKRIKYD